MQKLWRFPDTKITIVECHAQISDVSLDKKLRITKQMEGFSFLLITSSFIGSLVIDLAMKEGHPHHQESTIS